MAVGDAAELTRVASAGDVAEFVDSIGDRNPIHHDYAYAATTRFGKPIVPGRWTAGVVSAVLGTRLPGPGSTAEDGGRVHRTQGGGGRCDTVCTGALALGRASRRGLGAHEHVPSGGVADDAAHALPIVAVSRTVSSTQFLADPAY